MGLVPMATDGAGPGGWAGSVASDLRAVFYLGFGVLYLTTWIAPMAIADQMVRLLVFYVIFEAMTIMVTMGSLFPWMKGGQSDLQAKLVAGLILAGGTLVAGLIAWDFGQPWVLVPFLVSLGFRGGILVTNPAGSQAVQRVEYDLITTVVVFLGMAAFPLLLPVPALGITPAVIQAQGFDAISASSDFFQEPELALAWGTVYFLGLAAAERYDLAGWMRRNDATRQGSD